MWSKHSRAMAGRARTALDQRSEPGSTACPLSAVPWEQHWQQLIPRSVLWRRQICLVPGQGMPGQHKDTATAPKDQGKHTELSPAWNNSSFQQPIGKLEFPLVSSPCASNLLTEALHLLSSKEALVILSSESQEPQMHPIHSWQSNPRNLPGDTASKTWTSTP